MSAITGTTEFIIYKTGSNHKLFRSNLSNETAGVIDIQTDFDTLWANLKTTVGSAGCSVSIRNGVYDYDATLTPSFSYWEITGENKNLTVLRPQGNIDGFSTDSRSNIVLKNLRMLTEVGATYTKKLLKAYANNISQANFDFRDLILDHFIGSTRQQYGSAFAIELAGANPAISILTMNDVLTNGFLNVIEMDSTTNSPTGNVWSNENSFNRIKALHPFNFVKCNQGAAHDSFKWDFHECFFQTTAIDGTTGDMFNLDDNAAAIHRDWHIDKCEMWDPVNTNKKFLKVNTNSRINVTNCDPMDNRYMGGSGWDATNEKWNTGANVYRASYQNQITGYSTFSASGIQVDFNVNPGKQPHQNADKCRILVQPISNDVRSIPYTVREDNRAANQFTVRFGRPPRKGTNNVVIYWEVKEF